jgi:hypothetical protein
LNSAEFQQRGEVGQGALAPAQTGKHVQIGAGQSFVATGRSQPVGTHPFDKQQPFVLKPRSGIRAFCGEQAKPSKPLRSRGKGSGLVPRVPRQVPVFLVGIEELSSPPSR